MTANMALADATSEFTKISPQLTDWAQKLGSGLGNDVWGLG